GRIHLFAGQFGMDGRSPLQNFDGTINAGAMLTTSDTLWSTKDSLMKYDIVIMSCEGNSYPQQKPMAARQALYDYASAGGRVFASHYHDVWFAQGPNPVPTTGTWKERNAPGSMGPLPPANEMPNPLPATINQGFPKGAALAKWLVNVGASTTLGQMQIEYSRDTVQAVDPAIASEWITMDNPNYPMSPKSVQYLSFNTPIGATEDKICGREVYTDVHVASTSDTTASNIKGFPASCEIRDLSAQEKVVAFMLFDLSACVQSEDKPPKPPK
ncbi:MAG TPA: carboxypeptidase regulatory-like domain-containing protein, partial [Polyangiaceae bacterium]|nr:carboxypeptidase regulatory-like domain-containing protein [Polyangiaceae bacterium]